MAAHVRVPAAVAHKIFFYFIVLGWCTRVLTIAAAGGRWNKVLYKFIERIVYRYGFFLTHAMINLVDREN